MYLKITFVMEPISRSTPSDSGSLSNHSQQVHECAPRLSHTHDALLDLRGCFSSAHASPLLLHAGAHARERERDHWDLTIAAYYDYDAGHGQRQGGGDSSTDRPTALSPGLRAYPTQT